MRSEGFANPGAVCVKDDAGFNIFAFLFNRLLLALGRLHFLFGGLELVLDLVRHLFLLSFWTHAEGSSDDLRRFEAAVSVWLAPGVFGQRARRLQYSRVG